MIKGKRINNFIINTEVIQSLVLNKTLNLNYQYLYHILLLDKNVLKISEYLFKESIVINNIFAIT